MADGKEAFIEYFEHMAEEHPGKKDTFKRAFAEGGYVILHYHKVCPESEEYAGIDIFRLDKNVKVVENWHVLQVIPGMSHNGNTMF